MNQQDYENKMIALQDMLKQTHDHIQSIADATLSGAMAAYPGSYSNNQLDKLHAQSVATAEKIVDTMKLIHKQYTSS
ncbi:hypothetical protein ACTJJ8_04570 [Agrobacterium radiobacter]|uniref:hypothetical protein n=1 Tax=Agrobacterium radiobacter TaxID=362 RepID=UPI003F86185C